MKKLLSEHKIGFIKIIVSVVLAILGLIFAGVDNITFSILSYFASLVVIGYQIYIDTVRALFKKEGVTEKTLMTVTSLGAFLVGAFFEGCAVMILYTVGEIFEDAAIESSKKSLEALASIRPDTARLMSGDVLSVEQIEIGQIIEVRAGERIPLDGDVVDSVGSVDTSLITGESLPVSVRDGNEVLAGCLNCESVLYVKVKRKADKSAAQRIIDLSREALDKKTSAERFITTFAKFYTPIVIAIALLIAVIPPFFDGYDFGLWIYRALTMLAISCPCALVVSVPLAYFCGIGYASKNGILIKNSSVVDALADVNTIAFDKTGTITKSTLNVTKIESKQIEKIQLLKLAATAELKSNHPIALAIIKEANRFNVVPGEGENYNEIVGEGVECDTEYGHIKAGKRDFVNAPKDEHHANVYISLDGKYVGSIVLGDELKENSKKAFEELVRLKIERKIILSGDKKRSVKTVAKNLLADSYFAELSPEEKLQIITSLTDGDKKGNVAYCGDGINDTPSIAKADVGIAMGALGSDSAVEVSDVVVMDDDIAKIPKAIKIARRTRRTALACIIASLGIKAVMLVLGALGFVPMIGAVVADVGLLIASILIAIFAGR